MLEYLTDHHLPSYNLPILFQGGGSTYFKNGFLVVDGERVGYDLKILSLRFPSHRRYFTLMTDGSEIEWCVYGRGYIAKRMPVKRNDTRTREEILLAYLR